MAALFRIELGWPDPKLNPNNRAHRMAKAMAGKAARKEAYWATCIVVPRCFRHNGTSRFGLTIHAHPALARERDDDNLIASLKPHRDGIAEALGVDDRMFDLAPVQWGEPIPGPGFGRGRVIIEVGPSDAG